jgi:hypothetical protein
VLALARIDPEFLIVGDGTSLDAYRLPSFELASHVPVSDAILSVAVYEIDPATFAVACVRDALVFLFDGGHLQLWHALQLMLQSPLEVLSLAWVPVEPYHLAVATTSFVKIFNVPGDVISPVVCYESRDKITSAVVFEHCGEAFIAAGLASGRVAIAPCHADASRGALSFPRVVRLARHDAPALFLSYSRVSDIIFAADARGTLVLCRPAALLEHAPFVEHTIIPTGASFTFAACHPAFSGIHVLAASRGTDLALLEITDDGVAFAPLALPALGVCALSDSICAIGSDGRLFTLAGGCTAHHPPIRFASPGGAPEFRVPPTFWIRARIAPFTAATDDGADVTQRFLVSHALFDATRVALTRRPVDPGVAIVGVSLGCSGATSRAQPRTIALCGRHTQVRRGFRGRFDLPLRPEEAAVGGAIRLEIETDVPPVQIDGLRVHVAVVPRAAPDWRTGTTALTEFTDEPERAFESDAEFFAAALSAADVEAGEGTAEIVRLMYTRPRLAHACRRLLLKAFMGKEAELEDGWARGIATAVADGDIRGEGAALLWRDFALLPLEKRAALGDGIWRFAAVGTGVHTLVAALFE